MTKILILDIETAPMLGFFWNIWQQNIALNQIKKDWHVLAWAAKWLGDPSSKIFYADQRKARRVEDDRILLKGIWKLLDQADIIITQNGKAFDEKKLNTRFILNGFPPPSSYRHIDTKEIATRKFGFTSNKLEYMSEKLCKRKKLKHKKFPGFELWSECLKGNLNAWKEMERYNKVDVLATEELYLKFRPWDNSITVHPQSDANAPVCNCGSKAFQKAGIRYTNAGAFHRLKCRGCSLEIKHPVNLLKQKKKKKK